MTMDGIGRNVPSVGQASSFQVIDTESKGIENQISNARQQLQKLSSDQEMTEEEKKQKRQEVREQIAELNRELRQHRMELHKEQLERQNSEKEKRVERENQAGKDQAKMLPGQDVEREDVGEEDEEERQSAFPSGSMSEILSAETTERQTDARRKVVMSLEGTARIMQSEIQQDGRRGQSTERKEEALQKMDQRILSASSGKYMDALRGASSDESAERGFGAADRKVFDASAVAGVPKNDSAQRSAIQSYHAGKQYSSVTFRF